MAKVGWKRCRKCGDMYTGSGCLPCHIDYLSLVEKAARSVVEAEDIATSANRRLGQEGEKLRGVAIDRLAALLRNKSPTGETE